MAATVATSQPLSSAGMGLNPLQAQGLAAASQQQHLQQQPPPQQHENGEPFDLGSRKLMLSDFQRVRTLGTGNTHSIHSGKENIG